MWSCESIGFNTQGGNTDPWAQLDGRLNAPAGVQQHATLLNGYPTASPPNARVRWTPINPNGLYQSPWEVASVDYPVGIDQVIYPTIPGSLKDPNTILSTIPGATGDNTARQVSITGNNVLIDGYDFSKNNGWLVSVQGANDTVQNCYFSSGASGSPTTALGVNVDQHATNALIQKNYFDCLSNANVQFPVAINGTSIVRYNWIKEVAGQSVVCGSANPATGPSGGETFTFEFNLIENSGMQAGIGFHGDWLQYYNFAPSDPTTQGPNSNSLIIQFNTCIQSANNLGGSGPSTRGLELMSSNNGASAGAVISIDVGWNTLVCAPATAQVNTAIGIDTTRLIGNAVVHDNYCDPTAAGGPTEWEGIAPSTDLLITGGRISGSTLTVDSSGPGMGGIGAIRDPNSVATASSCTIAGSVLTVGGTVTGTWQVGLTVLGAGVPFNTTITSLGTGTGGAGTYNLSGSATISTAETMKGNFPTDTIYGGVGVPPQGGVPAGTAVIDFIGGATGGNGQYLLTTNTGNVSVDEPMTATLGGPWNGTFQIVRNINMVDGTALT